MNLKRRLLVVIIVFALLILAGLTGLYVITKKPGIQPADRNSSAPSSGSGTKTFCSDYGYLCLEYPKGWKLSTFQTSDEAISPETTTITSPSGDVVVTYRPNFGATNRRDNVIMTPIHIDVTRTPDLQAVSLVERYNGGGIVEGPYTPNSFVTNDLKVATGDTFMEGISVTSEREPVFHVFTPRNNDRITSFLYVKYDQNDPYETEAGHYVTYEEAVAALEGEEAKAARRILQSARYKD